MLDRNASNHLTVCKQMDSSLFKMLPTSYSFTNHIYIYIYKQELALTKKGR